MGSLGYSWVFLGSILLSLTPLPVSPLFWFLFGYPLVLLRPAPIPNYSLPPPILPSVPPVLGDLSALSRTGILLPLPIGSLFRKTFSTQFFSLPSSFSLWHFPVLLWNGSFLGSLYRKVFSSYFFSLFLPLFSLSGLFRDPWGFSSLPRFIPRFPFLFSSLLLSFGSFRASLGLFGAFFGILLSSTFPFLPLSSLPFPIYTLSLPISPFDYSPLGLLSVFSGLLWNALPRHYSDRLFHYSDPLFTIPTSLGHYSEKLFFTYHYSLSVPILPLSPPPPAHWLSLELSGLFRLSLCFSSPLHTFPGAVLYRTGDV